MISSTLRGCFIFDLTIKCYKENIHSGYAGITPDPYIIGMSIVNRLMDFKSHKVSHEFEVPIPQFRLEECKKAAASLPLMSKMIPSLEETQSMAHGDPEENFKLLLN